MYFFAMLTTRRRFASISACLALLIFLSPCSMLLRMFFSSPAEIPLCSSMLLMLSIAFLTTLSSFKSSSFLVLNLMAALPNPLSSEFAFFITLRKSPGSIIMLSEKSIRIDSFSSMLFTYFRIFLQISSTFLSFK